MQSARPPKKRRSGDEEMLRATAAGDALGLGRQRRGKVAVAVRRGALAAEALDLLRGYSIGEVQLIVPDLFWPELANVLWKATRLGRCTTKNAETGLKSLRQLSLRRRLLPSSSSPRWPSP